MATVAPSRRVGADLTQGPIFKQLITFAIPFILTSIIQQLYTIIDLMIAGHYIGAIGTVGVSVGSELSDLLTPAAMAFATAGQIYMAQLVGAGNHEKVKESIGTLWGFTLSLGVIVGILGVVFHGTILDLLNCPDEAREQAAAYMVISCIGFPFVFGYNSVCSVLRAMGDSKKPLIFVTVSSIIHIFAALLFVIVFKLEAAGTAIATVISQMASFVAAFICVVKYKERFGFEMKLSFFRIRKEPLMVILKLGLPQLCRTMLVRFSMAYVNSSINAYGMTFSATNSVGNKLQKFIEVFVQGVDSACSAMIGQNLGARKPERAKKVVLYTLGCTMFFALCSSILTLTLPRQLYGLFTTEAEVIELGVTYLRIMVLHFFSSAFIGPFQAMVNGSGFVELGFAIGILDGVICKVGLSLLFANVVGLGAIGFFWGTALSRVLPGILCCAYFLSGKWATRKLLGSKKKA